MVSTPPHHRYPPAHPIVPFQEWLDSKFGGDEQRVGEIIRVERPDDVTLASYAEYNCWVWEDPKEWLLDRFSLQQIGRGLWQDWRPYLDINLPRDLRNRAWEAASVLFRDVFSPFVSDHLAHLNEVGTGLNGACYMWWDVSCCSPESSRTEAIDMEYFLSITRECLFSERQAIQESAIHGLGECIPWGGVFQPAQDMLDEFIASGRSVRPELIRYAEEARTGCIQ